MISYRIEHLLTTHDYESALVEALRAKHLPELHYYQSPGSVRAWNTLCESVSYKGYSRSYELVKEHAGAIASIASVERLRVVSIGAGAGIKDQLILQALTDTGCIVENVAVDASELLMRSACISAGRRGIPTIGIRADIFKRDHLKELQKLISSSYPCLFLLLGGNLGAWNPLETMRILRSLMKVGDLLLVDAEIYAGEDTLAQYDNPINRNFAIAPLREVGITERDGILSFWIEKGRSVSGLVMIKKSFSFEKETVLQIDEDMVRFRKGDVLKMSGSGKFQGHSLQKFLACAGFNVEESWIDSAFHHRLCLVRHDRAY